MSTSGRRRGIASDDDSGSIAYSVSGALGVARTHRRRGDDESELVRTIKLPGTRTREIE